MSVLSNRRTSPAVRGSGDTIKDDEIAKTIRNLPSYKIIRISRIIDHGVSRQAQSLGLSAAELRVLLLICRLGSCTLSEAIHETTVDQGNTSRLVSRLVDEGKLKRIADPQDGRKKKLQLTETGKQIIRQVFPLRIDLDERIFEGFSDAEREQFDDLLARVLDNVSQSGFTASLGKAEDENG